eukprot:1144640-Pelagomonas_calceolata.AAC.1
MQSSVFTGKVFGVQTKEGACLLLCRHKYSKMEVERLEFQTFNSKQSLLAEIRIKHSGNPGEGAVTLIGI